MSSQSRIRFFALVLLTFSLVQAHQTRADTANFWAKAQDGSHVILMRHALAPGTGDPANFQLRNCATQRNLSDQGRDQARRIGALFKQQGILSAGVYSSQWCRCLETARLLDIGGVTELPIVNSFFQNFERRDGQTDDLKNWIAEADLSNPTVVVTHQVNISALTGGFAQSGEMVLVRRHADGTLSVTATLETD